MQAFLVLALGGAGILVRAEIHVGDHFPALLAENFDGTVPVTMGHVTVVDFWASWCAPCQASFPVYGKIAAEYESRGLLIVGVSVDEKAEAYAGFVKKLHPGFTTVRDRGQKLVKVVQVPAMPTSYVLDRDGVVRYIHQGFHGDTTTRELRAEIDHLLTPEKPI